MSNGGELTSASNELIIGACDLPTVHNFELKIHHASVIDPCAPGVDNVERVVRIIDHSIKSYARLLKDSTYPSDTNESEIVIVDMHIVNLIKS